MTLIVEMFWGLPDFVEIEGLDENWKYLLKREFRPEK